MLIITADDLGFSPSRNQAILDAAEFGTVSSVSLMVNMPDAQAACVELARRCPTLGVGLHFTLTSGKSVARADEVPLLVDSDGYFRHGFVSLWRRVSQQAFLDQVSIELNAQLQRLFELQEKYSLQLDHLDSHQHVHAIGPIFALLASPARQHGWALRVPRERYGRIGRCFPFRSRSPIGDIKRMILRFALRNVKSDHLYFGVLESGIMDRRAWQGILESTKNIRDTLIEVNVHPGYTPSDMQEIQRWQSSDEDQAFHLSAWRHRELQELLDPSFIELLKRYNRFPLRSWHS